ncbi:MAG: hypothetical protein Q9216_003762 [Gyalolechia sp. 2 TL-2023]
MRRPASWRAISIGLPIPVIPARLLAGRHHSTFSYRTIHSSQRLLRSDQPPGIPKAASDRNASDRNAGVSPTSSESRPKASSNEGPPADSDNPPDTPGQAVNRSYYGSASRRAGRNLRRLNDVAPFRLPSKFLQNNVILNEVLQTTIPDHHRTIVPVDSFLDRNLVEATRKAVSSPAIEQDSDKKKLQDGLPTDGDQRWRIDARVLREVESTVLAGLQTPAYPHANTTLSAKPHVVLHCPKKGGTAFLDTLVKHLASKIGSDLVQVDAQDLAEIGGDYLDGSLDPESESLSSLGYDIHAVDQATLDRSNKPAINENAIGAAEDPHTSNQASTAQSSLSVVPVNAKLLQNLADIFKGKSAPDPQQQQARQAPKVIGTVAVDSARDQKLALFLDSLFNACDVKRADREGNHKGKHLDQGSGLTQNHTKNAHSSSPALILHVNDYPEIFNTSGGGKLMDAMHTALQERRTGGERILLLGTCASENASIDHDTLLHEFDTGPTRTVLIPPFIDRGSDELFLHHHKQRILSINVRHMRDMIRRLTSDPEMTTQRLLEGISSAQIAEEVGPEMQKHVWSSDHVHRIATIVLGIKQADDKVMTSDDIKRALEVAEASDNAKHAWLSSEKERTRSSDNAKKHRRGKDQRASLKKDRKQLEKECNAHEKRLLRGVVDSSDIRTTFAQVHAPKETIQALKDLTLLPLACPDEFEYGVLAEQTINGILLYGPPGTGKTLLAKAVAKEGGATILEVSGADLYNKWVGEGEKNVKAMFSLARKLKPCIVFIDEADGILGGRGNDHGRPSHRDLINQFLREWDGMKETTALIMVATNRPFDLDDAVVRRLPRRMLVDLPTEKDREEILKIHLQKETLDPEVSLAKLAAETPLYSGSDLKHLVVTAAQACVRENYDVAKASPKNPPNPINPIHSDSSSPPATLSSPPTPSSSPPPSPPPSPQLPTLEANQRSAPSAAGMLANSNWHDSLPSRLKALIPSNPFTMIKPILRTASFLSDRYPHQHMRIHTRYPSPPSRNFFFFSSPHNPSIAFSNLIRPYLKSTIYTSCSSSSPFNHTRSRNQQHQTYPPPTPLRPRSGRHLSVRERGYGFAERDQEVR